MAIRYPERVNKLVLASTAAISSQRNNELFADLEKHLRDGEDYSNWVHRWMVWLFSSKKLKDAKFIDEFTSAATAYSYHQTVEGFHGQVEAIKSFDAGNRIDQIKAKTLVLEGEEDILIPPAEAELLAQGIPGSKFQLLKGTGHAVHLDSPELFVSAVLGFLKNNSGEDAILGSMRNTTQNDFDKSYHAV
jgi:pimeloyl-ACP methyl ester carboxylesterase